MKVKKFDKATCKEISMEISKAMETIAKKYGMEFVPKSGSFNNNSFTKRVEFQVLGEDGNTVSGKKDFELFAPMYGLTADMFGKTFKDGKKTYQITGFAPRSRKYPVEILDVATGKTLRAAATYIKNLMK